MITPELLVATLVIPTAAAALAFFIVGVRASILALIGAGHLANLMASGVRDLFDVPYGAELGLADPVIWVGVMSALIAIPLRLWRHRRGRTPRDG